MQLTERHIIKSTEHRFAQIDELAFKSKNLYFTMPPITSFVRALFMDGAMSVTTK
jgi:hypothetical protein